MKNNGGIKPFLIYDNCIVILPLEDMSRHNHNTSVL